jgi:hypothetical protein
VAIDLLDGQTLVERWEYKNYPNLRLVRMPLPEVEVTLLGWGISEERLLSFASRLEPLELGSDLLQRMSSAVAESNAAFSQALTIQHEPRDAGGHATCRPAARRLPSSRWHRMMAARRALPVESRWNRGGRRHLP